MERLTAWMSLGFALIAVLLAGWAMHALTNAQLAVAGLTAASAAAMLRASTELQRLAALIRRLRETP